MSQSIINMSTTGIAAYRTSETYQGQGANFTISKEVEVMSSSDATDTIDLSPDAKKALQSFLSNGTTESDNIKPATSSDSGNEASSPDFKISVTAATSTTTGRQPDHATASDYNISWTDADGQTDNLEVEESSSFTTNQQLVPLSPQLQASDADDSPGITTSATSVTISDSAGAASASITTAKSHTAVQDDGKAALMMLEASLTTLNRYSPTEKAGSSSETSELQPGLERTGKLET